MTIGISPSGTLELARRTASASLPALLLWHMARLVLRLAFLASAAVVIGRLVMGEDLAVLPAALAVVALAASRIAGLAADRRQAEAEAAVADGLRAHAGGRLGAMPARQVQAVAVGALVAGIQRHPGAVAGLVVGHRLAGAMMAAGPAVSAMALAFVSWQAALLVLVLTPVMIVFFALVGDVIRRSARAQEQAFNHLAGQFADRVRTLPTILANHALATEHARLAARLRTYADRTMRVLRTAFLNAAVIDFFASLSIAMLAVFLGLGHLGLASIPGFAGLELWQSLFILMVAPEYFAPFRRYAEQYHARAEGEAAAAGLDRLLGMGAGGEASSVPVDRNDALPDLPRTGLVALVGPSGSGKTVLLRRMAGVDGAAPCSAANWHGSPRTASSTGDACRRDRRRQGGRRAGRGRRGAPGRRASAGRPRCRDRPGGANLSGGQRLRVAVARALHGDRAVLADEPTAKLDAASAQRVRAALRAIADQRLVVVATHDEALAGLADRTVRLDAGRAAVDP